MTSNKAEWANNLDRLLAVFNGLWHIHTTLSACRQATEEQLTFSMYNKQVLAKLSPNISGEIEFLSPLSWGLFNVVIL